MKVRGLLLLIAEWEVREPSSFERFMPQPWARSIARARRHPCVFSLQGIMIASITSADRIIPANAQLEKIATGFTWTEGPVWLNNSLYFADITGNSIRRWTPDGRVSIVLQPSGQRSAIRSRRYYFVQLRIADLCSRWVEGRCGAAVGRPAAGGWCCW